MKTKSLIVDGKVICEYESTGDDIRDIVNITEILKNKGLYKELSDVDRMHGQATHLYKPQKIFTINP
ncbi:MAG: hypothetical protein K0R98_1658 [Rickettsiaceae bacterium]|jgi:hypothetical protein|nr:hypothetical protein [Rickettsiaceae bacterium]